MDIITGIGIALAGYFIGDGLKNFKSPDPHEHTDHILIKEKDLHFYIGIISELRRKKRNKSCPTPPTFRISRETGSGTYRRLRQENG